MRRSLMRCFLLLLLCGLIACCQAEGSVSLSQDEWTWNAGEVATFQGTVTIPNPEQGEWQLQLSLEAQPEQEDLGRCFFTYVGGKKIKIRNQSETAAMEELPDGEAVPFQGSWVLPEEGLLRQATLRVSVISPSGAIAASTEMVCENGAWYETGSGQPFHLPVDLDQMVWILAGCCAVLWAAAIVRSCILRRKRTE